VQHLTTLLLLTAAFALAALFLSDRAARTSVSLPRHIDGWQQYNETGIRLGRDDAAIEVTAFVDFTCPYSRALMSTLDAIARSATSDVAIVLMYFPLSERPGSRESAMAAECSRRQGALLPATRRLMEQENWSASTDFASWLAPVLPDPAEFVSCVSGPAETFEVISEHRYVGLVTGVIGTPTVWVNGTIFSGRSLDDFNDAFVALRKARRIGRGG
jgi:protein-disulfide isomerase